MAFLGAVRSDIAKLTSEERTFFGPEIVTDERLPNLIRVTPDGAPLTVLRDADRPRLEHWKLKNRLDALEQVVALLDKRAARRLVRRAISDSVEFLQNDVDWVENAGQILRILQLGLRTMDWGGVRKLLDHIDATWIGGAYVARTRWRMYYRGKEIRRASVVRQTVRFLRERRLESICQSLQVVPISSLPSWFRHGTRGAATHLGPRALFNRAALLAAADLRAVDREDDKFNHSWSEDFRSRYTSEEGSNVQRRLSIVSGFLDVCSSPEDTAWRIPAGRLFLSTRPPSYTDIARRVLRNEENGCREEVFDDLTRLVNAIRGTRYWTPIAELKDGVSLDVAGSAETYRWRSDPRLILGNLLLTEDYYRAAVRGNQSGGTSAPITDLERLRGLGDVLSKAHAIARRHSEACSLLVLPELGLPRAWFRRNTVHLDDLDGRGPCWRWVGACLGRSG